MRSIMASETGLSDSGLGSILVYQPSDSYCVQKIVDLWHRASTISSISYTVTFSNNIDARENTAEDAPTAIFTATEDGNYCGSLLLKFTIIPKSLEDDDVTVTFSPESSYYTGQPITPDVTVKFGNIDLVRDRDYTLEWEDNTDAGTATVSVKAYSDNYTDTKTAEFTILAAPASGKVTITGADNKVGTELTASVTGNTHILFQFTPLREGRLYVPHGSRSIFYISIHAPARGATAKLNKISVTYTEIIIKTEWEFKQYSSYGY